MSSFYVRSFNGNHFPYSVKKCIFLCNWLVWRRSRQRLRMEDDDIIVNLRTFQESSWWRRYWLFKNRHRRGRMEGELFLFLCLLLFFGSKKRSVDWWKNGTGQVIPHIIATGMLDKVRQLAFEIHYHNKYSLEEWRAKTKIIRSIEEYGFVRFSSKVNLFSSQRSSALGIDVFIAYELAWFNPSLTR